MSEEVFVQVEKDTDISEGAGHEARRAGAEHRPDAGRQARPRQRGHLNPASTHSDCSINILYFLALFSIEKYT